MEEVVFMVASGVGATFFIGTICLRLVERNGIQDSEILGINRSMCNMGDLES